jgi:hypothetical protein
MYFIKLLKAAQIQVGRGFSPDRLVESAIVGDNDVSGLKPRPT